MGWGKVDRDELPEGVTRVEYIEGTGTQYVDTEIIPTIDTSCEVKCMSLTFVGWAGVLGSSTSDGSADTFYLRKNGNSAYDGYTCWIDGKYYNQILVDEGDMALCQLSKTSFDVNGTSVALNATSYGTAPTLPMFLFAINLNGRPWINRYFRGRIYYCKIWDNGVLVRDYVPVRFVNDQGVVEGAMWDKVSRQLFRNKGTGSFLYGPDTIVSKPVIRLHRQKEWVNPYVTDGLVAMWDGEWNAGGGVHDASATTWKDIIGNIDLSIPSSGFWSFGNKTLDLARSYHTQNGNTLSFPQGSFSLNEFSVEMCSSKEQETQDAEFGFTFTGSNMFLLESYSNTTVRVRTWNASNTLYINSGKNIGDTSVPYTLSITYDGTKAIVYVNGIQLTQATQTFLTFNTASVARIGNLYLHGWGSFYNIRAFSRALTAEEIAHNYARDKQRFNLP